MAQEPRLTSVARDSRGRFTSGMSAPGVTHEPFLRDDKGKFLPRSALNVYNEKLAKTNGKTVGGSSQFSYKPPTVSVASIGDKNLAKKAFNKMGGIPEDVMSVLLRNSDEVVEATNQSTTASREVSQSFDKNTAAVRESAAQSAAVAQANKEIAKETRLQHESLTKFMEKFNRGKGVPGSGVATPYKYGTTYMPEGDPRSTLVPETPGSSLAGAAVKQSLMSRGVRSIDRFFGAGVEESLKKGFGTALLAIAPRLATTLGIGLVAAIGTDFFIKGLRDSPLVREREQQREKTAATNRAGAAASSAAPTNPNSIFGNDPNALKQYNALKTAAEREAFLLQYGVDPAKAKQMAAAGTFTPPSASVAPTTPNISGSPTGGGGSPNLSNPTSSTSSYTKLPGDIAPSGTISQSGMSGGGSASRVSGGSLPSGKGGSISPAEAVNFFKSKGWSEEQAAGIVANLVAESGLRSDATGDGGKAYGMGQWHPDRQANFAKMFGHDITQSTPQEQLAFVDWELNNTEKKAGDALKSAKSRGDAASIVSSQYERPADRQGEMDKRSQIANNLDLTSPNSTNVAVGDSIAAGTGKAGNMATYAKVGDSPQAVLDRINGLDDSSVKGKNVVLSSGYSNNPSQVDLVQKQIDALKSKGAASIKLLGVGDRKDLASGNDKLAQIAQSNGITFGGALDPNNLGPDRVHPRNYSQLASSARLENPPQSSTGQAIVTSTNIKERLQDAVSTSNKAPIVAAPVTVNSPALDAQNKTGGNHLPPVRNDDPVLLQAMRSDIKYA